MAAVKEGWTYLVNSPKWHYFTSEKNTSLCGRFMLFALGDLEQGNDNSADNCKACMKKLEARKSKETNDAH